MLPLLSMTGHHFSDMDSAPDYSCAPLQAMQSSRASRLTSTLTVRQHWTTSLRPVPHSAAV